MIQNLAANKYSNVRILVDFPEYDIEKDTRILIPFSYVAGGEHFGLMNRSGEIVVQPEYDCIPDSCRNESDVVRVGMHYTYGFNRVTTEPSTYLITKWGLVDSKGNFLLEPQYREIKVSDDKKILTLRHMDYQYEVISIDGEVIVPKGTYSWIDCYDRGLARVSVAGDDLLGRKKSGIIDAMGKEILPLRYSYIHNFCKKT